MESFRPGPRADGRRAWPRSLVLLTLWALSVAGCGVFVTEEPSSTRYGTAAQLATEAYPDGADVVLLATGSGFADALAAAPLAAALGAPILLTQREELPDATGDALGELNPDRVILLGGTNVIGEAVHDGLVGYDVDRFAGDDRYETAAMLAKEAYPDGTGVVLLATGRSFADALAAAPLAASLDAPILLTDRDSLPTATLTALSELGVAEIVLLGGTKAISQRVEDALEQGPFDVRRHAGADRFDTAAQLAAEAFPGGADVALLATGEGFADALAAAPLALVNDAPILLTAPDELPAPTVGALDDLGVDRVMILGGEAAVSEDVEEVLSEGYDVERLAGG